VTTRQTLRSRSAQSEENSIRFPGRNNFALHQFLENHFFVESLAATSGSAQPQPIQSAAAAVELGILERLSTFGVSGKLSVSTIRGANSDAKLLRDSAARNAPARAARQPWNIYDDLRPSEPFTFRRRVA